MEALIEDPDAKYELLLKRSEAHVGIPENWSHALQDAEKVCFNYICIPIYLICISVRQSNQILHLPGAMRGSMQHCMQVETFVKQLRH